MKKKVRRIRPRSLEATRKLTPKRVAFFRHYADAKGDAFGNATRACKRAGYKGDANTLAVQGHRNLKNPDIQAAVRNALEEQGFTPEFSAKILMDAMRATVVRVLPNRKGKPGALQVS